MVLVLPLLTWLLAGFVAAASVLAVLFARRPMLGVSQHWGLQLWWLALLGMLPALWLRDWPAFALCAAVAAYWSLRLFRHGPTSTPEAAPLLRLVSANLAHFNRDLGRAAAALGAMNADVIALCEVTAESRARMRDLAATHPFATDTCDLSAIYGILILSRRPFRLLSRGGGETAAPRHIAVRLELEHGPADLPVDLIAVHLANPTRRDMGPRIPAEIEALVAMARGLAPDLILCGDCNAASWSSWLRRLERAAGLGNDRRLNPSWPLPLPAPLRLPIDHVWARGRLAVTATRLGPPTGSDHLPLIAEIGRRGDG